MRRLAVAFLEGTVAAPFTFANTFLPNGLFLEKSGITAWEAIIRYIVSSTIGCYFVKPEKTAAVERLQAEREEALQALSRVREEAAAT